MSRLLHKCSLLRYKKITINNKKIIIPLIQGIGFANLFRTELFMNAIIQKISEIKKGAFVDVGVNLGQTLIELKSLDFYQTYYGFEPNPMCYHYTRELIKLNNFPNSTIFPVGLSNKNYVALLFYNSDVDSSGSIIEGFRDPRSYSSSMYVPIFNGDRVLTKFNIGFVSTIKIDVEGGELEVIQGLNNTISGCKPFIICEILPIYDENSEIGRFRKSRQNKLQKLLDKNEYKIFRILNDGHLLPLDVFETHSDLSLSNYVFVPKCSVEQFSAFY